MTEIVTLKVVLLGQPVSHFAVNVVSNALAAAGIEAVVVLEGTEEGRISRQSVPVEDPKPYWS